MTFGEGGTGAEEKGASIYPVDILKGYNEGDHRGTAGSVYWDLRDGDIAVIAAGGEGETI